MIIQSVRLVNIKSYVDETIDFSHGINCILGLNGSGKSTLMEAIGFALFNYNRYNPNSKLLRYKEKRGFVEVDFIAEDGLAYKIKRTLRTNSTSAEIIDKENNNVVCEGIENVYAFVKKVLNINNTKEFSRMFAEIIAVPQGEYVTAFLQTASVRKESFDKLFELHVYKNIANKLKDLIDFLTVNYINKLEKEIIELAAQLYSYQDNKNQLKNLETELVKLNKNYETEVKALSEVSKKKKSLEETKKLLEDMQVKLAINKESEKHLNLNLEQKTKSLKESEEADAVLKEHQASFINYQLNKEKIAYLEKEYDEIRKQEQLAQEIEKKIAVLELDLSHKTQEQNRLNEQISQLKTSSQEIQSESMLAQNDLNYKLAKHRQLQEQLEQKKENVKKFAAVLKQELEQISYFETRFETMAPLKEGLDLKLQKEIDTLDQKIQNNEILIEQLSELEKQQNYYEKDLQTANDNAKLSIDGMCPFLHSKCKNIDEGSLVTYFEDQASQLISQINEIVIKTQALQQEMIDIKDLVIKREQASKALEEDKILKEAIFALKKDMLKTFSAYISNSDVDLKTLVLLVRTEVNKKVQEQNDQVDLIAQLEKENNDFINNINSENQKIAFLNQKAKDFDLEVKKLNLDLEKKAQEFLEQKRLLDEEKLNLKKLDHVHNQGLDLKLELSKLKEENGNLEEAKNLYIANEKKAKELQGLEKEIKTLNNQLTNLSEEFTKLENDIEKIKTTYSNKALLELISEESKLIEITSVLKTTIFEKDKLLQELIKTLAEMEELRKLKTQKQKEILQKQDLAEFMKQMRKTYTDLPMRLSQTYREYICVAATSLYREIAQENVRLELTDDYLVCLYDDKNPETFKTIDQLSGGEQMSVAIAIRLSMLKHIAGVDIYILDEPTINLDSERREMVASVIQEVSNNLSQLFVISHDDTFDDITQNVVNIVKTNNISQQQ